MKKSLKDIIKESEITKSEKEELLDMLDDLMDSAENDVEESMIGAIAECVEGDYITEEAYDIIYDAILSVEIDDDEEDSDMEESVTEEFKRVVRKGKRIRKRICKPGYKAVSGKCVKMDAAEKMHRRKAARVSAMKKRGKRKAIARKVQKTRKQFNV